MEKHGAVGHVGVAADRGLTGMTSLLAFRAVDGGREAAAGQLGLALVNHATDSPHGHGIGVASGPSNPSDANTMLVEPVKFSGASSRKRGGLGAT